MDILIKMLDKMFKITETYKMSESAEDDAVALIPPYIKHLLWYYETNDAAEKKEAMDGRKNFADQIEKEINDMEGRPDRKIRRVEVKMLQNVEYGEKMFYKQYGDHRQLINPKAKEIINKQLQGSVTFKDLGIAIDVLPKNKVKLTVIA